MSRYFTQRLTAAAWVEDDHYSPDPGPLNHVSVPEHEAADTGLLDASGNRIWRAPNPMGFGRDGEW